MNSLLIVAGENSGENYGASLVHEFKKIQPSLSFFGIGGKRMAEEGVQILFSTEELAVVGGIEILSELPRIKKIFNRITKEIKSRKPKAAVLIDSPDFNLRLAKKLKKINIPVLYYISPTVWAWRKGRLKTIKKTVDKMLLIFPFEEAIYREKGIEASYVGHPLKERVKISLSKEEFFKKYELDSQKKLITLLPGSRKSELKYHLPVLMRAVEQIKKDYKAQFVLVLAESLDKDFVLRSISPSFEDFKILTKDGYEAMAFSDVVLSACGTANLEAALLEAPLISFYRISPLTYFLGVKLVKIKSYSIVNILAGKKIIPELIERRFTARNIFEEVKKIFEENDLRQEMKANFKRLKALLGEERASQNAARELEKLIQSKTQGDT